MKLSHIFLIGSAVAFSVGTYMVQTGDTKDGIHIGGASPEPSTLFEKSLSHKALGKDTSKESEMQANLDALRKEVALLKADVSILKAGLRTALLQTGGNTPAKQAAAPLTEAEQIAKDEESYRKYGEALDNQFRQQAQDALWSAQTKQMLQDAFALSKIPAEAILDIDCRTTMCRVELASNTKGKSKPYDMVKELPAAINTEFPEITMQQNQDPDGTSTSVLYLSKEELDLAESGN